MLGKPSACCSAAVPWLLGRRAGQDRKRKGSGTGRGQEKAGLPRAAVKACARQGTERQKGA